MKTFVAWDTLFAAVCCLWLIDALPQSLAVAVKINPLRDAYYGDLHLHTSYSFDAYLSGATGVGPDEAYRFAKGESVDYLGQSVRRREPLDFLAVTDHSENIGVLNGLDDSSSSLSKSEVGKAFTSVQAGATGWERGNEPDASVYDQLRTLWWDYFGGSKNKLTEILRRESASAWTRVIAFANRHYEPGKFTTFIAYEWTSMPYGSNLHRNVIFKGDSAPNPFTAFDSKLPEDLWAWLESIRNEGFEALAIPHNGNASNGLMYGWVASDSVSIGQRYAKLRQANEPLSEMSQNKGASETHPLLSPNDEFANYEIYDFLAGARRLAGRVQGSYLRDALSKGLVLQRQLGVNPYKDGFVGASDLHGGLSVSAQADYGGINTKVNMGGGRPTEAQVARILSDSVGWLDMRKTTAGNLTGVWAESNTRESIYNALRRKETFATTGAKLKFRFFGGWDFGQSLLQEKDWVAHAYARGVPMGGDLPPADGRRSPTFVIWAMKDPNSGNLDRAQVIKVWEEGGQQKDKVFDVAWAGARKPDPKTGRIPAIGNTVDLKTGHYAQTIGAAELRTVWRDPEFNPSSFSAYYLRVLEIPTPRWSTLLAFQSGVSLPKDVPATIQQRAWSSPIWYAPTRSPH